MDANKHIWPKLEMCMRMGNRGKAKVLTYPNLGFHFIIYHDDFGWFLIS